MPNKLKKTKTSLNFGLSLEFSVSLMLKQLIHHGLTCPWIDD